LRIKRRFNTTIASLLLILVFFSIRMMLPNNGVNNQQEINFEDFQKVVVTKVVDGDTIWVEINGEKAKVRLIGVNTPEKGEAGYTIATEYANKQLLNHYILLEKDISNTDKYGRLLRYVWLDMPSDNIDSEKQLKLFNGMLLENGHAEIATYKPDIKYLDYYKRLVGLE